MNFTADPEIGRFISQDSYRGELNDPGQWHLYTYCANNPINYVDPSGHVPVAVIYLGGVAICSVGIVGCLYTTTSVFQNRWQRSMNNMAKYYGATSERSRYALRALCGTVAMSFARLKSRPKYKSKNEVHHIVAKTARRAKPARVRYIKSGHTDINASFNIVTLKTGLHRRLHTKVYYDYVNKEVMSAYGKRGNKKQNVRNAVTRIKNVLKTLNDAAPI